MTYVVFFIGDDGELGQTFGPIFGWDAAVAQALVVVADQQQELSSEQTEYLNDTGKATIPGGTVHIGGLESVD